MAIGSVIRSRIAVIGSGPAGFYTAHQLIKKAPNVLVDVIEKLPVPFGLVRFGVAPDHPEVKNVTNQFTTLAKSERCRFIGNVNVGEDISLNDLRQFYSGVVMAYGAEQDSFLNIPGEEIKGVYSARSFVGWYNGLPQFRDLNPDLSGDKAVIIGHGNVALDVARMLLSPVTALQETDICYHAVDGLKNSNIKKVVLIGRRGPLQVSFTIKELREMIRLPNCRPLLHSVDFEPYRNQVQDLPRPRRRITELMMKTANETPGTAATNALNLKSWELKFLWSPVELLSTSDGHLRAVRVEKNELTCEGGLFRARGTGCYEELECSVLFRSIGYKSTPIDYTIPFDHRLGVIPNRNGRVVDSNNEIIRGLYCSGWVKRGPVGVILTTMNDAFETAEAVAEDISNDLLPQKDASNDLVDLFNEPVLFSDWEKIDKEEQRRGEKKGKPREKIVAIDEMLRIIR